MSEYDEVRLWIRWYADCPDISCDDAPCEYCLLNGLNICLGKEMRKIEVKIAEVLDDASSKSDS